MARRQDWRRRHFVSQEELYRIGLAQDVLAQSVNPDDLDKCFEQGRPSSAQPTNRDLPCRLAFGGLGCNVPSRRTRDGYDRIKLME